MRWCRTIVAFATLLLAVSLPVFSELPIGRFGGVVGGGNGGGGFLLLHGWALDDDGVASVDIFVDGVSVGRAVFGDHRPGVAAQYPTYPDAQAAGYTYALDTTQYFNGLHVVQPRVTSITGERVFLNPARELGFTNTVQNLVPFGGINFPSPNAQLFGVCDLLVEDRRLSIIEGWTVDAGVEIGDAGVGYVELLIDGSIVANTRTDCDYLEEAFGLVNCYGGPSPAIAASYPTLPDATTANFRFSMDIGLLIELYGYTRGRHQLTIRVGDISGQVADIEEIPVDFRCDTDVANIGSFGRIGAPNNGRTYSGLLRAVGWALDWEGVEEIRVYVDGVLWGLATHGGIREGVTMRYPSYPESSGPGWTFFIDTTLLANGDHALEVEALDVEGWATLIGERTFKVENP